MAQKLRDSLLMEAQIVESNRGSLPEGVLLRVRGLCQKVDVKNANGRIYPRPVWENIFSNENWLARVKDGGMIGEADHPESNVPSIQRASHVVREVEWSGGEDIYATFDILDTPTGRILETLFKAGVKVGVSSRGDGSTRRDEVAGGDIVEVGYEPDTWDFVINPSTSGAFPTPIHEAVSAPEYQRKVIEAVEGIVNSSPSRTDLLECYTRLQNFDSGHTSINEARNRLMTQVYEKLTKIEEDSMNGNKPVVSSDTFIREAVDKQLTESIQALEERLAKSNGLIVERDQRIADLESQLKESENWQAKYTELVGKVGDISEAEQTKKKLDAARTKAIPELLAENERLQGELDVAREMLKTHEAKADSHRVAAYIETAISGYPEGVKSQVRGILGGCRDIVEVDQKLTQLEDLGLSEAGFPPALNAKGGEPAATGVPGHRGAGAPPPARVSKGQAADAGSLPASGDWMPNSGGTVESRRPRRPRRPRKFRESVLRKDRGRGRKERPLTMRESETRSALPRPRNAKPDGVIFERSHKPNEDAIYEQGGAAVRSLVEALGK